MLPKLKVEENARTLGEVGRSWEGGSLGQREVAPRCGRDGGITSLPPSL